MNLEEKLYLDNEHYVMLEVSDNKNISQRELSNKLNISLGSINILINKMVREGLIKIEKVSRNQVLYMLTPKGALEKARKTMSYLKSHYRIINQTQNKIKIILYNLSLEYEIILIYIKDDDLGEIVKAAINEMTHLDKKNKFNLVYDLKNFNYKKFKNNKFAFVVAGEDFKNLFDYNIKIINLFEKL